MCQIPFSTVLTVWHLLFRVRVRHPGVDQGGVIQVHRVHWDRVPGPAVAASPTVGPKLDPRPVQA